MTGTERLFGKPRQAAILLKNRVKNETALVISVGIGPTRFIAKMASDFDKPDGLCRVSPGKEIAFVDAVVLRKLWGIGDSTLDALAKHAITTDAQLREYSVEHIQRLLGEAAG
jgi:DNA polymerase-4